MTTPKTFKPVFSSSGHSALLQGVNSETGETFQYVSAVTFSSARLARQFFGPVMLKWPVTSLDVDTYRAQFENLAPTQRADFKDMPTRKVSA